MILYVLLTVLLLSEQPNPITLGTRAVEHMCVHEGTHNMRHTVQLFRSFLIDLGSTALKGQGTLAHDVRKDVGQDERPFSKKNTLKLHWTELGVGLIL